jgi:hypothetical protein
MANKPKSTAPGGLTQSMGEVAFAFAVLIPNGVSPVVAFVLAVAAVIALKHHG